MFAISGEHDLKFLQRFMGQRRLVGKIEMDGLTAPQVQFRANDEMIAEVSRDSWLSYALIEGKHVSLLRRVKYYESTYWSRFADSDPDHPNTKLPFLLRLKAKAKNALKYSLWWLYAVVFFGILGFIIGLAIKYWAYLLAVIIFFIIVKVIQHFRY
jgi:hypothetical protein